MHRRRLRWLPLRAWEDIALLLRDSGRVAIFCVEVSVSVRWSAFLGAWRLCGTGGPIRGATLHNFGRQIVGKAVCLPGEAPELFGEGVQTFDSSLVIGHKLSHSDCSPAYQPELRCGTE
jgi:hypothetical protein